MLLYNIIFTYSKKYRLIHTPYFISLNIEVVCVCILLDFESVVLFILLGPQDPTERSRHPPNDGKCTGIAPKVHGSIFMPASLYPFCFPSFISYKREKHTC